jgi:hypothetical protein
MVRIIPIVMLALLGAACSESAYDCRDICQTVQSCVVTDIDVSDCTSRCDNYADVSSDTEYRVELCNECLDARACGLARDCAAACDFIVVLPD